MIKIAPSILSADFVNLERDIKKVQKALMKEEQMATDEYLRQALRLLN